MKVKENKKPHTYWTPWKEFAHEQFVLIFLFLGEIVYTLTHRGVYNFSLIWRDENQRWLISPLVRRQVAYTKLRHCHTNQSRLQTDVKIQVETRWMENGLKTYSIRLPVQRARNSKLKNYTRKTNEDYPTKYANKIMKQSTEKVRRSIRLGSRTRKPHGRRNRCGRNCKCQRSNWGGGGAENRAPQLVRNSNIFSVSWVSIL